MEQKDIIEEIVEIPTEETEEKVGNIKISDDVVASIAGIATTEIEGVAGMSGSIVGGIREIFTSKKNPGKGVKVDIKGNTTIIDVYLVVEYGARIPELAWEVQESVKNAVETMTGLDVEKVNIHIEGVSFEKENKKNAEEVISSIDEEENEIIVEETIIEELPEE